MYASNPTVPLALGPGNRARGVTYRVDSLTDWAADVDWLIEGMTAITEEAYEAIVLANNEHNASLPPLEPPPTPTVVDVMALKAEALDELGLETVLGLGNYLALFAQVVDARNWERARQVLDHATVAEAITPEQRTMLLDLMTAHGVPEPEA